MAKKEDLIEAFQTDDQTKICLEVCISLRVCLNQKILIPRLNQDFRKRRIASFGQRKAPTTRQYVKGNSDPSIR